ncbi:AT-rich interactive domain-containing protein 4B [Condylostylus longicornis]|uniref:AT-rich interactive domain-containing protein 4B n=1 Tax=Condylostylus longicornis TaxID=2530218 RepID=UPI00244DA867|nr:AT-rich interactive domain-containing protein 4B [Condylostylus longicornis]
MQQVDDPPSLPVGTEVSAKYKGAFCEAKVRKVVRNIKVKVLYKQPGLGSGIVPDDAIKTGILRVGASVEVKHPERRDLVEATITKIQDGSQYTVVFDDGDITTLRRTALCLKSGRHFNESETLDQLPLTHPEHFSNPVIGGRRGRRSRHLNDDTSDEEEEPVKKGKQIVNEKEENIGRVVCVETTDAKKKDKYFPGLVVAPTAQATVKIRVKDEYLVRSFKDGRYYTVPKKEAINFTRELASKMDGPAVQAAINFLENNELPPHWDRDSLFGLSNSSSDYEGEVDSDSSDDEPTEEKDHFVAQLYKYMDDRGTPLNKVPSIQNRDVDLYRLFRTVQKLGGYNRVTSQNQWKSITNRLGFTPVTVSVTNLVKQAYKKFLQPYEEFHRKLGCSMIMTSRGSGRSKGRSLVRANSVASPKPDAKTLEKTAAVAAAANASALSASVSTNVSQPSISEGETKAKIKPEPEESENTSESSVEAPAAKNVKRKISTGSNTKTKNSEKFEDKKKEDEQEPKSQDIKKEVKKEKELSPPPMVSKEQNSGSSTSSTSISANKPRERGRPGKIHHTDKIKNLKKKENEIPPICEKTIEKARESVNVSNDFPVEVGDKLKVYYHEKRVTYEAKVIEISLQQGIPLYMVHYTGWNNRYDEWIPKERIAENLTNTKAKKSKMSQGTQPGKNIQENLNKASTEKEKDKMGGIVLSSTPSTPTIKSINSSSKRGRGRSDSQPPRSTTPSSVASNSSRTKSPATPVTQRRNTRTQPCSNIRRTSNNVSDISIQTDSDSDSDTPVLKKSIKSIHTTTSSAPTVISVAASAPNLKGSTSIVPKITTGAALTSSGASPVIEISNQGHVSPSKLSNLKVSVEVDDENAKGRDYDLNQIRSELKGFKELKSPSPDCDDKKIESDFDITGDKIDKHEHKKHSGSHNITMKQPKIESKSSTDFSSECDSFGDDDSQSSDKTTQLENMTEKLQQKIKAEKLAQAAAAKNADKFGISKSLPNEKLSPLSSSGIEKIIKDSLAEKRQETLKASKPFLIEKTIFKSSNVSVLPNINQEKSEKHGGLNQQKVGLTSTVILKTEANLTRLTSSRQISTERKITHLPSSADVKKNQSTLSDKLTTITSTGRPEKKPILTAKANASIAAAAVAAAHAAEISINQATKTDTFVAPNVSHKYESKQNADVKGLSAQFQHKANISGSAALSDKLSVSLITKSCSVNKEILKNSNNKSLQTMQGLSTSCQEVTTSDVYEFKEPEPFEFEARKTSTATHTLSQSLEIEKKKKPITKSFDQLECSKPLLLGPSSSTILAPQVTVTTTPMKKAKKSPIKDPEAKSLKKSKPEEKVSQDIQLPPISILSIQSNITPMSTAPSPTSVSSIQFSNSNLSIKGDSTFDVLRKSPSFNLNINALNEELATAIQETTKVLTDVTVPITPIPMTSVNTIPLSTIQKPTFVNTFVEATKSTSSAKTTICSSKNNTQISTKLLPTSVPMFCSSNKPVNVLSIKTTPVAISKPISPQTHKVLPSVLSKTQGSAAKTSLTTSTSSSVLVTKSVVNSAFKLAPNSAVPSTPSPDLLNVFEVKQDNDNSSKSESDDDHDKSKKGNELETVKKMLSDPGILEPPKIEKSSIADKVLKALNQKKEEEEKTKENLPAKLTPFIPETKSSISSLTKPVLSKIEPIINKSPQPSLKSTSAFSSVSPASGIINTSNRIFSSSPILNEPPKIEMPVIIKKDFENALKKPVLNSPEHKLNILESIAPKNNDLTETIQKLESAIKTTSNVDHFDPDSSDSTDSERRLVIEDEESSDNLANDTLSAPEYSPLKKQEIVNSSPMKTLTQATMLLPQTSIVLTTKCNTEKVTATLTEASINTQDFSAKKSQTPEQSIFTLTSSNTTTVTAIGPRGNTTSVFGLQGSLFANPSLLSDTGVKPICDLPPNFKQEFPPSLSVTAVKRSDLMSPPDLSITPLKKEDTLNANQEAQSLTSDSINLLLCEETIPGSPTPIPIKEIVTDQNIKLSSIHPTESDIKPIPMDIEINSNVQSPNSNLICSNIKNTNSQVGNNIRQHTNPSTTNADRIECARGNGSNKNLTKVEQQTPSSSPRDSQSQDESSEDLKKQVGPDIDDISPKKRRRTRTHSEAQSHHGKRRRSNRVEAKKQNPGSDSDENSDTNATQRSNSNRPIRPCPYNFLVQLDPNLNPNQRIAILRKKIADLRKTYNMIKAELASIDRRRKKLRRREREKKIQQKQQHSQQIQSQQQYSV